MRMAHGHVRRMRGCALYAHGSRPREMHAKAMLAMLMAHGHVMCMRGYARYAHGPRPCEVHAGLCSVCAWLTAT